MMMKGMIGMKALQNRIIDEEGNVVYFVDALIELLYNGEIPSEILYPYNDKDILLFNKFSYENADDIYYSLPSKVMPLNERKEDWFYPSSYDNIELQTYFINKAKQLFQLDNLSENIVSRINLELKLYQEKGFEKFLRFCIFLSEKIIEKNWIIGVGRGSSCASYLLYILQIHLVDSLKYNLDITEFLK